VGIGAGQREKDQPTCPRGGSGWEMMSAGVVSVELKDSIRQGRDMKHKKYPHSADLILPIFAVGLLIGAAGVFLNNDTMMEAGVGVIFTSPVIGFSFGTFAGEGPLIKLPFLKREDW
jgi:hypothetical protein